MPICDVIWDAGHGGRDPGAVFKEKLEKEFTLPITLYQHGRAKDLGLKSKVIRSTDVGIGLNERANQVAISGARVCISNHINAGRGFGAEVYYSLRHNSALSDLILQELIRAGACKHGKGVFTRGSKTNPGKDYYRMHYTGITETVIVEYGFIDNPSNLFMLERNWEKYAESLLRAVCKYLNKPYTYPKTELQEPRNSYSNDYIGVVIGQKVVPGRLIGAKTWAPVRELVNAMGRSVRWEGDERKVYIE